MHHAGRVVVPYLRHAHDARQQGGGNDAEVADVQGLPGQHPVQHLEQRVAGTERRPLGALAPLREHDPRAFRRAAARDQRRDVVRGVLAVGVHHDHQLRRQALVHVAEPEGNRALVPDVAAQGQDLHRRERVRRERQRRRRRVARAVVHQHHVHALRERGGDAVEVLEQAHRAAPVVEHRDAHRDAVCGARAVRGGVARHRRYGPPARGSRRGARISDAPPGSPRPAPSRATRGTARARGTRRSRSRTSPRARPRCTP